MRSLNDLAAIQLLVKALEADRYLADSDRFRERAEALDLLDGFNLNSPASSGDAGSEHVAVYERARELQAEFENANSRLYEHIRDAIRCGTGRNALLRCVPFMTDETIQQIHASEDGDSYDYLDEFVSGIFRFMDPDLPKIDLSAEMVAYQPTPARHIFNLIQRIELDANDVFIDLGSGLGHVPLLIATCTKARAIGIELEPAYVECVRHSAHELNLTRATFLSQDARETDLSDGTVFYLYTPFRGAILRVVLDRLRAESSRRAIRVCTFGPCTPIVAAEPWLALNPAESGHISVFRSRK
jgi:Histone methylation protein DOT1